MSMIEWMIKEGQRDRSRPAIEQTSGGWLAGMVVLAIVSAVIVDFLVP